MFRTSLIGIALLAGALSAASCGSGAAPAAPTPEPAAPPAQRSPDAVPGTAAYACPGIDRLDTKSKGMCHEMGCMNGFSVTLYPTSAWPPGKYRFVMKHDATTTTCEGSLPLKPCEEESIPCDGKGAGVGASGCALPPAQHSFGMIGFEGFPSVVDIDVLRDDVLLTHAHYDVRYTASQPNGRGCAPACCSAPAAALTLPSKP